MCNKTSGSNRDERSLEAEHVQGTIRARRKKRSETQLSQAAGPEASARESGCAGFGPTYVCEAFCDTRHRSSSDQSKHRRRATKTAGRDKRNKQAHDVGWRTRATAEHSKNMVSLNGRKAGRSPWTATMVESTEVERARWRRLKRSSTVKKSVTHLGQTERKSLYSKPSLTCSGQKRVRTSFTCAVVTYEAERYQLSDCATTRRQIFRSSATVSFCSQLELATKQ